MELKTQTIQLFRASALTNGAQTTFQNDLKPDGTGWLKLCLQFLEVVVIGTGSGAITEGELRYIKAITLQTSAGEKIVDGVSGKHLYRWAQDMAQGVLPSRDAIAASDGTYAVFLTIWLVDTRRTTVQYFADGSQDGIMSTVLNTMRYSSLTLQVTLGTVADLFTTVGTSTVATTLTCVVERTAGRLPLTVADLPQSHLVYGIKQAVNPSTQAYFDLDREEDLSYKRFLLISVTSCPDGDPGRGTVVNTIITDIDVVADQGDDFDLVLDTVLRRKNIDDMALPALLTGIRWVDLARPNAALTAMIRSGAYKKLQVSWTNDSGVGGLTDPRVSLSYLGVRPLKELAAAP